jgi:hypothetical protein
MRFFSTAFSFGILASSLLAAEGTFQNGDSCGVKSSDFVNDYFAGKFLVAGTSGCNLSDDETGCFCAPDFDDQDPLSEWKWQCNDSVDFGPVDGKVCPDTMPIPKESLPFEIEVSRSAAENTLACDTSVHPTGRPGDEVCPYSDCDQGGDTSAICGCVNLANYGMGEGQQWFCLQSTCSCEEEGGMEETGGMEGTEPPSSSSVMATVVPLLLAICTLVPTFA